MLPFCPALVLILSLVQSARPPEPATTIRPLWGQLAPGPHAVGFRTRHVSDRARTWRTTRTYDGAFRPDTAGRPIQIDLWYPAETNAKPMLWQDYVQQHWPPPFAELNPTLRRRSRDLAEGAVPEAAVTALMNTPTAATKEARPKKGSFPAVLYFGGLNADLNANAVLAEFLASHGYVFASVSLLGPSETQTNQSRTPKDIEATVRDMEHAWSVLTDVPEIDRTRVATMGHSVGAIEAILFAMRNANVSATISLDGTHGFKDSVTALTTAYAYSPDSLRAKLLDLRRAAGEQSAELDLTAIHSFRYADRTLVTLRNMHHSDFTSFAMLAHTFHTPINSRAPKTDWTRTTAQKGYEDAARITLAFLDDQTKKTPPRLAATLAAIDGAEVTRLPATQVPPSPLELVRLVAEKGLPETKTLLLALCANDVATCLEESPLNSLGYELLSQDRPQDARAALDLAAWSHPTSANAQDSLADACLALHDTEAARQALERAITLAPSDPALDAAAKASFIASATARIRGLN